MPVNDVTSYPYYEGNPVVVHMMVTLPIMYLFKPYQVEALKTDQKMATKYHVRSISLPSRSHPTTLRIEDELKRLKTSEPSALSATESISAGLSGLGDLYQCMDELLNMSSTQQVLSMYQHEKCIDELLDGYVKLLDICGIARDYMFQIKEHVHALQSALRRRKGD
ncbi:hypothetical protein PVK06_006289 [Gossypium arboreum]|uniref:Uncharacterized protein n=2 Tax=Gossypium TaxID=3633 RepID=A0ABR0QXW8_GOSAR|nr:hypothetical protein PVK06_006289 [Gossypium arboreum]